MHTHYAVGGSRNIHHPSPEQKQLEQVVYTMLKSGMQLSVGCCSGADALALQLASQVAPSQVQCFAQFGPGPECAGELVRLSASGSVQSAAARGVVVHWLAGGPLSVPPAARLIRRSQAVVQSAQALVLFAPGAGSLSVAAFAVSVGRPVFVFGSHAPATIGAGGQWVASSLLSLSCWSWQSAQLSLL